VDENILRPEKDNNSRTDSLNISFYLVTDLKGHGGRIRLFQNPSASGKLVAAYLTTGGEQ
jgi:hypothetical protein